MSHMQEWIAYTVCQHFGIDTSDYSFGYIAGWSSGKDMKELKSSLDTIRKTASELITGTEGALRELQLNREMEQEKDMILLVRNSNLSEYDLLNVRGMEKEELFTALHTMDDDDRLSVEAYLESKGAWVTLLGDEKTEEVEEYHLDYIYNADTRKIRDVKELQQMQEKSLAPVNASDVIVKVTDAMGSEYEIDKITNMTAEQVKGILYDMAMLEENEWDGNAQDYKITFIYKTGFKNEIGSAKERFDKSKSVGDKAKELCSHIVDEVKDVCSYVSDHTCGDGGSFVQIES